MTRWKKLFGPWKMTQHLMQVELTACVKSDSKPGEFFSVGLTSFESHLSYTGTGSVLNSKGEVEMDAVIMNGQTLEAGAVASVHNIANPVSLARLVMEKVKLN